MIEPVLLKNRQVGPGHAPLVIAEACVNHEGDIDIAKKMVYIAHALGVECIKFQIHCLENEMLKETPESDNFVEPLWDTLDRTNLSVDEHLELKKLCEELGILYLCTPFSRDGADILDDIGLEFFKIGSGEMTNLPFIEHVAKKGKPMIVSTGMCELDEIQETVDLVKAHKVPLILTHCVSIYPCPHNRVNLGLIPKYSERFGVPVGLSDHTRDIYSSLGAVAFGACLVEKHFTLDKMAKGIDHASSIEPYEFGDLAKGVKAIYESMGNERIIYPEEKQILAWARESVVSEKPIKAGETITEDMVWVKRPSPKEGAIAAKHLKDVIGKTAVVDIEKDVQIKWDEIK